MGTTTKLRSSTWSVGRRRSSRNQRRKKSQVWFLPRRVLHPERHGSLAKFGGDLAERGTLCTQSRWGTCLHFMRIRRTLPTPHWTFDAYAASRAGGVQGEAEQVPGESEGGS